jgi:type IV secretory pathway TrbD component
MTDAAARQVASKGASHAAGALDPVAPAAHAIRQSLVRPMLYLGVDRTVIAVEATLCLALICGAGPQLPSLAICAFVVLVLHPIMVWLTADDPLVVDIYMRSWTYRDFYLPHATIHQLARKPQPSVPAAR